MRFKVSRRTWCYEFIYCNYYKKGHLQKGRFWEISRGKEDERQLEFRQRKKTNTEQNRIEDFIGQVWLDTLSQN